MTAITLRNAAWAAGMRTDAPSRWNGIYNMTLTADMASYYGGACLKAAPVDASQLEGYFSTVNTIAYVNGHKYYCRVMVKASASGKTGQIYFPYGSPYPQTSGYINTNWTLLSFISENPEFPSGNYALRLDNDINRTNTTMWYDGLLVIDLTAAFGAGKEPDKAWCDRYLPFFEGTLEAATVEREGVTAVVLTPNPVLQSGSLSVSVTIESGTAYAVPYWYDSGDLYAGEV